MSKWMEHPFSIQTPIGLKEVGKFEENLGNLPGSATSKNIWGSRNKSKAFFKEEFG
jgi:hypothetical protein